MSLDLLDCKPIHASSAGGKTVECLRERMRVLLHAYNNQHQITEGYLRCVQAKPNLDQSHSDDLASALDALRKSSRLTHCMYEVMRGTEQASTLEDFLERISDLSDCHGIQFVSSINDLEDSLSLVLRGDSNSVYESVAALLDNSLEASQAPSEVIIKTDLVSYEQDVEEHGYLQAGSYLKIVIRDSGLGMTPQLLAESYSLFCSTKPSEHGVGLGISVAQAAMDRLQGSLQIKSQENLGTEVTLQCPLI